MKSRSGSKMFHGQILHGYKSGVINNFSVNIGYTLLHISILGVVLVVEVVFNFEIMFIFEFVICFEVVFTF